MKFSAQPRRRSQSRIQAIPAAIEIVEARQLLTTLPTILTPTGTVDTATPEITWEAVDNAVSYDLWVTSLESFETILVEREIPDTNFTPASELALGVNRMWVRANFEDGTSSAWSAASEVNIDSRPEITGPIGPGGIPLVTDTTPTIEWTSGTGASYFQIWVTDTTTGEATQYNVQNLTPRLDANGDAVLDGNGDEILDEVRSFTIPEENALEMGRYRVWVRSISQTGDISDWSQRYQFNAGPRPENLSPTAPTFSNQPLLTWDAIDRATTYEVFVAEHPFDTPAPPGGNFVAIYQEIVDTNSFQIPDELAAGGYVFWVRAIQTIEAGPTVVGSWSAPAQFSTLRPVTILGPVPVNGVVTDARPTVEWTRIQDASRYEVEVRRINSRPPFANVQVNDTSYRFERTIPAGEYAVWVRPINSRGEFGPWTPAYTFTATGGRPVVEPIAGQTLIPTITWQPVTDSDVTGYEVWISQDGVDFQFLVQDTVDATPSFDTPDPLEPGNYRVWVRAIFSDGVRGLWSAPLSFVGGVVQNESQDDASIEVLTVSVEVERSVESTIPVQPENDEAFIASNKQQSADLPAIAEPPARMNAQPMQPVAELDDLTKLAMDCVQNQWWNV